MQGSLNELLLLTVKSYLVLDFPVFFDKMLLNVSEEWQIFLYLFNRETLYQPLLFNID